jgi:WD40 repeat protein/DNA-binding SARP family transcriptional activator
MHLQLLLFGHYQLHIEGQPAKFATDHARALLAYLVLEARPHQRTTLATLLWPEQPEATARQNLRQTLVYLKKALQSVDQLATVLEITSKTVHFHAEALTVDVITFRQLLATCAAHAHHSLTTCPVCLQHLQAATELYQGAFLQGFFIKNSLPFEEWVFYAREQLHRQAVEALYSLTLAHERMGDYQAMQSGAARQLMLEPWREEAHRQRMRALALSGQPSAALAHYGTCVRILSTELGVPPSSETTALYEQIRAGKLPVPTVHSPALPPPLPLLAPSGPAVDVTPQQDWGEMPHVAIFHGRTAEMAQLQQWLVDQRYRVIALLGMGGLGKTTLAARLVQTHAAHFEFVIWRSLVNAPPLSEIIQSWLYTLSRQQLITLPPDLDGQLRLLLHYLRAQRCLLVLDNLESILPSGATTAPPNTLAAAYAQLWQLLATTAHQSCLLLTSREEPQGLGRLTAQPEAVALLHLRGLDPRAGIDLLRGQGLTATPATAQTLIEHYSGNPLALQLVATTIIELFDGDVALFQEDGAPIFDDIRAVLGRQFAHLSTLEQELMLWLAIEREPVTLPSLQENLLQQPERRVLIEALRALQRRCLIEKNGTSFGLQNVVIEFLTDSLVELLATDLAQQLAVTTDHTTAATTETVPLLETTFFNRFVLMKADTKESLRQIQHRLILQPIALRLAHHFGHPLPDERWPENTPAHALGLELATTPPRERNLPLRIAHLLDRLRATPHAPGYAAGNLLNLAHALGIALHGFNFSNLTVQQAYLHGVTLYDCDFRGTTLVRSVFTDTFGLINTIAISPDGLLLAAGTGDGEIRFWHLRDRQPAGLIQAHRAHVWSISFSPDGQLLASSGDDQLIHIWTLDRRHPMISAQPRHVLHEQPSNVHAVAFSPDGRTLATGGYDQKVRLWDVQGGRLQRQLEGHTGCIYSVAFSPDGRSLASGSDDCTVRIWALSGDAGRPAARPQADLSCQILYGHSERVYSVAFSPDGQFIASGSTDQSICLWRWQGAALGGQLHQRLVGHRQLVRTVAFSPDSQLIASGSYDETIRVWDVSTGQLRQTCRGHCAWIRAVAFVPDGQQLVSGCFDYTIRLWDLAQSNNPAYHSLRGYTSLVRAIAFSPDGQTLASGSNDQAVRLWARAAAATAANGQQQAIEPHAQVTIRQSLVGHSRLVRALAFSPAGEFLASGSYDYTVQLWARDAQSGDVHELRYTLPHNDLVRALAFSPDGQTLASGSSDRLLRLWDVTSGALRLALQGHTDSVWGVAFSPDGETVASCSADLTVKLWSLADGRLVHSFQAHAQPVKALAYSPDGRLLATGSEDQSIRVWAAATGELLYTCHGHTDFIWSVAFSADGQTLASSSSDRTVRLWDLRTDQPMAGLPPRLRHILTGHGDWVWMVAFHPDGQTLASCSDDATIKLWSVAHGTCLQTLRTPDPYAGMRIRGVRGLSAAQRNALIALGAVA